MTVVWFWFLFVLFFVCSQGGLGSSCFDLEKKKSWWLEITSLDPN